MNRRSARRSSFPFFLGRLGGRAPILVLAAALVVVTGPGAAASRGRVLGQTAPGSGTQTDPVAALAAELQYDPQKIFRYVADQIRYEPYAGILRGAAGTLEAQAGNSVDKAILLGALLDDSQVSHRFARGPLDQTAAAEIVASLATDAATARTLAQAPLKRGLDEIADTGTPEGSTTGPLATLYEQQVRSVADDGKKRLEVARSRLGDTATMLLTALKGAGISLPAGNDVSLPPDEVANHTWVEMANGATWVDFDPTLPGAEPGSSLVAPSETLHQLPDTLRYQVEFDVLVERVSGGQLVTDNALSYTDFADHLAGTPVTFGHTTPSGLASLGVAISNLLGDGWIDYRPTFEVGGHSLISNESVGFPGPGGGGIFGAEPSPGASPGPVDGEATAEWLEVHVTPPGAAPEVARRTVFDRLPADLRAANELTPGAVQPVELVDLKGTGSSDFPPLVGSRTFAVATGPTSAAPVLASAADPLGMSAIAYHDVRDAMNAQLALDAGTRTFINAPNVVSVTVDVNGDARAHTTSVGLDIWLRSHGFLPLTGSTKGAAQSMLVAGITDQLAERFTVDGLSGIAGAPGRTVDVGEVFDAAATQGIGTVVLAGDAPDSGTYGTVADRLIKEALASGNVVVIPAKPVALGDAQRVGWWTIDPKTGVTSDVMDDGSGQSVTEEAVLINGERRAFICYGAMANWASVAIMAAAEMVSTLAESAIFRLFNSGFQGTQCFGA